jgi:hypothetical protein
LIVEFARPARRGDVDSRRRARGATRRFRAVMMTAVSFIIGIMPMMLATGAGAQSRRIIGTTVFSGMLVATVIGILFIPRCSCCSSACASGGIGGCGASVGQPCPPASGSPISADSWASPHVLWFLNEMSCCCRHGWRCYGQPIGYGDGLLSTVIMVTNG